MPFSSLLAELDSLEKNDLLRRRRVVESRSGVQLRIRGIDYLSFCSNDYLGLAQHPELSQAAADAAKTLGVGSGASHLVCGHGREHQLFEEQIAEFVGKPAALLFSTGYMANIGVITALLGREDAIFCDKLNHASIYDAALLSRTQLHRYPHLDMNSLEESLKKSTARRKLVASDAVFSMDGDIAPLPELVQLCERYDAWLLVDDAHGFGVLGENGKGVMEHFSVDNPRIIYLGTLGKAAGVSGAFVAGEKTLIDFLLQKSRSYIYTTAQPFFLASALSISLDLLKNSDHRRVHLAALISSLRENLRKFALLPSSTPIQALIVGENTPCLALCRKLEQQEILVPAIRPPTVPANSARLRISLSFEHSFDDVERLSRALHDAC